MGIIHRRPSWNALTAVNYSDSASEPRSTVGRTGPISTCITIRRYQEAGGMRNRLRA